MLWYLGGCCVGAQAAPQYLAHAIFMAPRGVLLHFQYPDILMGDVGRILIVTAFLVTLGIATAGAASARWGWCRAGVYATLCAVGLIGGFAAVLEQAI